MCTVLCVLCHVYCVVCTYNSVEVRQICLRSHHSCCTQTGTQCSGRWYSGTYLQNRSALGSLKHDLTHQCFSRTGRLWGHWNMTSHINVSPEQVGSEVIETLPHTSMFLQNRLALRSLKHDLTHQCFSRTGWLWGHWNTTSHINVSPEQVGSEVTETLPHTSMFLQNRLALR